MPELSVIISVYNGMPLLKECLDSIDRQTFRDFELILVNDGSTDGTGEYLRRFSREERDYPVILLEQPNSGLPQSRKKALSAASGKYIAFVDADDWVLPEHFLHLINCAEREETELTCCGYLEITENLRPGKGVKTSRTRHRPCCSIYSNCEYISADEASRQMLERTGIYQYVWNKLFRREILSRISFPENNPVGEDFAVMMQYLQLCSNVSLCHEETICYRIHKSSMTQQGYGTARREGFFLFQQMYEEYKGPFPDSLALYIYLEYMMILRTMLSGRTEDYDVERKILFFLKQYKSLYLKKSNDSLKAKLFAAILNKKTLPLLRKLWPA